MNLIEPSAVRLSTIFVIKDNQTNIKVNFILKGTPDLSDYGTEEKLQ